MNIERENIIKSIGENAEHIEANMNNFWRSWCEDLVRGGIDPKEVTASTVTVACAQAMKVYGATYMADSLRKMAALLQYSADAGCEFPATEH